MRLNKRRFNLLSGIKRLTSNLIGNAINSIANRTNGFAIPTMKAVISTPEPA